MKKLFIATLAAGAAASLSACSTTQYAGFSNAPFAQVAIVQNPDCGPAGCRAGSNQNPQGVVPQQALQTLARYSASCQEQVGRQAAGPLQGALTGGATLGAAGSALGPVARYSFGRGASAWRYAGYGLGAGFANGVASGAMVTAQSTGAAKGSCVDKFWSDVRGDFAGTHVVVVTSGKKPGAADNIPTQGSDSAPPR